MITNPTFEIIVRLNDKKSIRSTKVRYNPQIAQDLKTFHDMNGYQELRNALRQLLIIDFEHQLDDMLDELINATD